MAVSTDDGHSRLGQTCFGTHHMDNSVFGGTDFENRDTVFGTVIFEHRHLPGGLQILYRQMLILCGYIVIGAGCDLSRTEYFRAARMKPFESLWTRYFVNVLPVDIEHT